MLIQKSPLSGETFILSPLKFLTTETNTSRLIYENTLTEPTSYIDINDLNILEDGGMYIIEINNIQGTVNEDNVILRTLNSGMSQTYGQAAYTYNGENFRHTDKDANAFGTYLTFHSNTLKTNIRTILYREPEGTSFVILSSSVTYDFSKSSLTSGIFYAMENNNITGIRLLWEFGIIQAGTTIKIYAPLKGET